VRDFGFVRPLSRRSFLALSAGVTVAACSSSRTSSPPPAVDSQPSASASSSTAASTPATTLAPSTTSPPTTQAPDDPPTAEYSGSANPFGLGVASGDPEPESVVLWTRLVGPAGEKLDGELSVFAWIEDADDPAIGTSAWFVLDSDTAYTAHVIFDELAPDRWYRYGFRTGGFESPEGRTRTTPAVGELPDVFTFASASCQNYEDGFYLAHRDIAEQRLDLVFWLGDYIYEGAAQEIGADENVRTHGTPEPTTLDEYRDRYALYKSDGDLQAAHASCPWVVTWDDHEVSNNYAGTVGQGGDDLTLRRAAAYQAWWEHTPTRLAAPTPDTTDYRIYRPLSWGTLVDASVLDTRQYRSDQTCGDITLNLDPPCPETFDPARTMLGAEQETWLLDRLTASQTVWNVVAQQVIFGNSNFNGAVLNYDQWDGYPIERDRILTHVSEHSIQNLVVLTGDIHFAGVGNLLTPAADGGNTTAEGRPVLGTEFVATSISSGGLVNPALTPALTAIPGIVDAELEHRGWIKHVVTPERWQADYRIVDSVKVNDSPASTWNTFVIDAGAPGARSLQS
jgi:alkaline phosphatase D